MSAKILLQLMLEVEALRDAKISPEGRRVVGLDSRCFVVISRRSGRGVVACKRGNQAPWEPVTPELRSLASTLWPDGVPPDLFDDGGGIALVRTLTLRLEQLIRLRNAQPTLPRVSRGWRVEALCF